MIACFTGHRPDKLGGYDPQHPMRVRVRRALGLAIDRAIAAGYTTFISGMAQGVDQDAAQLVLDRGARLVAAVACTGVERHWHRTPSAAFMTCFGAPMRFTSSPLPTRGRRPSTPATTGWPIAPTSSSRSGMGRRAGHARCSRIACAGLRVP